MKLREADEEILISIFLNFHCGLYSDSCKGGSCSDISAIAGVPEIWRCNSVVTNGIPD